MNSATLPQNSSNATIAALPAWRVILSMMRFRPWYWLVDLVSVFIFRMSWQIAPGLIIKAFFDMISGETPTEMTIWTIVALLIALWLSRSLGFLGFYYADVPLFAHVNTLLRRNLIKHILQRPGAAPLPDSPGEAVSRFRNDVREIPLFVIWSNDILVGMMVIVVSVVLLLRISVPITLLALAPLVIVGVIANLASSRIEQYRRSSRQATGNVTGFIGELFGAAQAVKVASAESSVLAHFDEINEDRRKMTVRERLFIGILDSIYRNSGSLGTGIVLILSGSALHAGTFTIGDLSLFVYLLQSLSDLTTLGGEMAARYRQLAVSVERMYRLMEGAPLEALVQPAKVNLDGPLPRVEYPKPQPGDHLDTLEAFGLSFRYPGAAQGIRDVSMRLKRGTLTVITGRVGSGKTTLLRVLLGLLPMDSGEIRWNNRVVRDPGAFFIPPRCSYTSQTPRLFSNSLRENILLGLRKSDADIQHAIYLAVMERDVQELERGLDTLVGPRGVKLSGGQMQRTAAARMLIRDGELLVFDDLSSALDVETERILWERLFERDGATCLVVSHRRAVLRRADHILLMRDGQVEEEGSLDELLEKSEIMRQIWYGNGEAAGNAGKDR